PVEGGHRAVVSLLVITGDKQNLAKLHQGKRVSDNERPIPMPQPQAPAPASEHATVELFEKAVQTHSRRLLAIARAIVGTRASPEDVVQQAVTNLFQHRHR